jgi:hypothetical protein
VCPDHRHEYPFMCRMGLWLIFFGAACSYVCFLPLSFSIMSSCCCDDIASRLVRSSVEAMKDGTVEEVCHQFTVPFSIGPDTSFLSLTGRAGDGVRQPRCFGVVRKLGLYQGEEVISVLSQREGRVSTGPAHPYFRRHRGPSCHAARLPPASHLSGYHRV